MSAELTFKCDLWKGILEEPRAFRVISKDGQSHSQACKVFQVVCHPALFDRLEREGATGPVGSTVQERRHERYQTLPDEGIDGDSSFVSSLVYLSNLQLGQNGFGTRDLNDQIASVLYHLLLTSIHHLPSPAAGCSRSRRSSLCRPFR